MPMLALPIVENLGGRLFRELTTPGYSSVDDAMAPALLEKAREQADADIDPVAVVMLRHSLTDRHAAEGKIVVTGSILSHSIADLKTSEPRGRASRRYLLRTKKNHPSFALLGPAMAHICVANGFGVPKATGRDAGFNLTITSSLFRACSKDYFIANGGVAQELLAPQPVALFRDKHREVGAA